MNDRTTEKALQEFLSEAQEIIETLNRLLLKLDEDCRRGRSDPDILNGAFRAVHSLKGLAGLFGVARMTTLSHHLEDMLDGLRLGKVLLSTAIIDLLFAAVELFQRIVVETAEGKKREASDGGAVEELLARLAEATVRRENERAPDPFGGFRFDAGLLSVLTEYEEHRLRENITAGRALFRVHAAFDLDTIDRGLETLKERLKLLGEVITYLPSSESGDPQKIELDLVVGAEVEFEALVEALAGLSVDVKAVPRTGDAPAQRPVEENLENASIDAGIVRSAVASSAVVSSPEKASTAPTARVLEPVAEGEGEDRGASLKSAAQTVRVDIRKLDHLMNLAGELGLVRAGIQGVLDRLRSDRRDGARESHGGFDRAERTEITRALHGETRSLQRKLDELQAAILEVRMVPLGQVFDKLARVVRKISRDAGKEIRLIIGGADTELDKLIVEELSDPLVHMIRNCIDHGIESRELRAGAGKPEAGTVAIAAAQRGNHVVISIEDDGCGLDEERLVRSAIRSGQLAEVEASELTRRERFNLIFLPGVSTREAATELSGRGVGMDVVKTNIARLSGIIDVESERGLGTRLTVTLPITLAIIQALVIRAAGQTYAVPLNSVLETLLLFQADVRLIERREVFDLRGATLPIVRLEGLFELSRDEPRPQKMFVVVVGLAEHRVGLLVDELVGQEDVVLKSLGKTLDGLAGIAGATELGGQQTVLVLDMAALLEESLGSGIAASSGATRRTSVRGGQ